MKNIFEENFDEDEILLQELFRDMTSLKKAEEKKNEEEISYCAKVLEFDLETLNVQEEVE